MELPPHTPSPRRRSLLAACLLALAAPGFAFGTPRAQERPLAALVRELESADLALRDSALRALDAAGAAGARAALDGFERAPAPARELRAGVLRRQGDGELLGEVLALCGDPAPGVRAELAQYLGRALRSHPKPSAPLLQSAVERLEELAGSDAQQRVRGAALESLSRADLAPAASALARAVRERGGAESALAARALAQSPRGGELVAAAVQSAFEDPASAPDEPALAILLAEGYGAALAEREDGGRSAQDRRPFVLGGLHPSPAVRAASVLAFDAFLARARFLGATARAEEVSEALARELADPARVLLASTVLTLTAGSDPARALAALERWRSSLAPAREADARGRFDLATIETLTAAALLARGEGARAPAHLAAARILLAGLSAQGLERAGPAGADLAAEVAASRAVVESYDLLALLRAGAAPDAPECQERARTLHELSLRAQLLQTRGALQSWTGDLDALVHHPHGPFDLLLSNPELERGLGAHPLDLALALARALATAAPVELPGFHAGGEVPELDDRRSSLASQIEVARIEQVQGELARLPPEADERTDLENALRVLTSQLSPEPDLLRVRMPSALAIELAGDLREEGRPAEARALAERAQESLTRADFLFGAPFIQMLIARAESTVGSCATDEGRPEQADELLNAALARLDAVASSGIDDLRTQAARSNVLVSLAVNANVKLGDPARALAYFERAFELRQDDFTRTLLACYRARAGRKEEARALLRELPESPFNYYNLACTHALLGEPERALDFLARELRPGTKSAGALERQRIWARTDPDLASLRTDPRFAALVGR